ncbi:MAG: hypothetical protein QOH69_1815 [Actinomycetota bacterium]|nr:hypothetical protein [Actinomycetota bacterium]
MFNHNADLFGENRKLTAKSAKVVLRFGAIATTAVLGTALALAAPTAASAATTPVSFARGQFLAGSIGGVDLAKLAAIEAATSTNDGTQSTQVSRDPLGVSVLGTTVINQPAGIQLNLGQIVDLGAAGQYAQAAKDGSSMGSSGAVNNDGGIGAGTVGPSANGSASVDLDSLLGTKFASVLSDLKLQADAVTAQATGALTSASGDYSLAGLTLTFTSPAIAGLNGKVTQALGPIDAQLAALDGPSGKLAGAVSNVVSGINPILNLAGANASVDANVTADLSTALQPLLTGVYGNGAVSFNLQTGTVTVDLAKLLGGNLNNEPVGTQVLSDAVVKQILEGITGTITTLSDQLVAKATATLGDAMVNVDATVNASTAQLPLLGQTCVAGSSGTGGLLGGLTGGLLGGVVSGGLGGLLCTNTSTLLPDLKTNLAVHVHGTVNQILAGTAPTATATLSLLGVPVTVDVNTILTGLRGVLADQLSTNGSGLSGLSDAFNTALVDPALSGLLGSGSSVETALTKFLSITLNNQALSSDSSVVAASARMVPMGPRGTVAAPTITEAAFVTNSVATADPAGKTFTETALKVQVLPDGTNGGLATIDLANASVGPNASVIVVTPPGDPGTPTTPGTPGTPGLPGSPSTPASFNNLAFTGVGIAGLVAAILALLAAGAYLVREGYRRNSRRQIQ